MDAPDGEKAKAEGTTPELQLEQLKLSEAIDEAVKVRGCVQIFLPWRYFFLSVYLQKNPFNNNYYFRPMPRATYWCTYGCVRIESTFSRERSPQCPAPTPVQFYFITYLLRDVDRQERRLFTTLPFLLSKLEMQHCLHLSAQPPTTNFTYTLRECDANFPSSTALHIVFCWLITLTKQPFICSLWFSAPS